MGTAVKQQVGEVSRRQKSVSANTNKQLCIIFQSDADGNQALVKICEGNSLPSPTRHGLSICGGTGPNTATLDSLKNQTTVVKLPQSHYCLWDDYSTGLPRIIYLEIHTYFTCILLPAAYLEQKNNPLEEAPVVPD